MLLSIEYKHDIVSLRLVWPHKKSEFRTGKQFALYTSTRLQTSLQVKTKCLYSTSILLSDV